MIQKWQKAKKNPQKTAAGAVSLCIYLAIVCIQLLARGKATLGCIKNAVWLKWTINQFDEVAVAIITSDCSHCDKRFGLFSDRIFPNLMTWSYKKHSVKTFYCSHCDRKFGLLFCGRNFRNLQTWRHKKYCVKTFYCSHCDKHFGLFWQKCL